MSMAIAILFFLLGLTFSQGRGAFLIAGYNTMSEKDKAKLNAVAMCKFMGKIMYGISFSFLLLTLSELFELQILMIASIILCIGLPIFAVIYANTGNRFNKEVDDEVYE